MDYEMLEQDDDIERDQNEITSAGGVDVWENDNSCADTVGLGGELDCGFEVGADQGLGQAMGLLNARKKCRNPVLRPPPTFRDAPYLAAFISHILLIVVLSVMSGLFSPSNGVSQRMANVSSWHLALNIVCLCAVLLGLVLVKWLVHFPDLRAKIVACSLSLALMAEITFGVEIMVFCLVACPVAAATFLLAVVNGRHAGKLKENCQFETVLMETVRAMVKQYPQVQGVLTLLLSVFTVCALFWSELLIGFIKSSSSLTLAGLWVALMCFSLHWTSQVLVRLMGIVVSGTLVSYYAALEGGGFEFMAGENSKNDRWFESQSLPWVFLQNGAGYSLGSVCKAALLAPFAQILWAFASSTSRKATVPTKLQFLLDMVIKFRRASHDLALVHVALYSKTLWRSSQDAWTSIDQGGLEPALHANFNRKILQWLVVGLGLGISLVVTSCQVHIRGISCLLLTLLCALVLVSGLRIAIQPFQATMNCIFIQCAENPDSLSYCETSAMIQARISRITQYQKEMKKVGTAGIC